MKKVLRKLGWMFLMFFELLLYFMKCLFSFIFILLFIAAFRYVPRQERIDMTLKGQAATPYEYVGKQFIIKACGEVGLEKRLAIVTHGNMDHHLSEEQKALLNIDDSYDIMTVGFTVNCDGLKYASPELARYINDILSKEYDEIRVYGLSKGGLVSIKMMETLTCSNIEFKNLNTPYLGSPWASEELMRDIITRKAGFLKDIVWELYQYCYSGSNIDRDVDISSEFLQSLDYSLVENYDFVNVSSTTNWFTLLDDSTNLNKDGVICFFVNWLLEINGDGIVSLESQEAILEWVDVPNVRTFNSHATLSKRIFHIADKAIGENEKGLE